jgi:hypothetical protein
MAIYPVTGIGKHEDIHSTSIGGVSAVLEGRCETWYQGGINRGNIIGYTNNSAAILTQYVG